MENAIVAKLNYLRLSQRKVRLSSNIIKGLSVNEAEGQLILSPRRSRDYLLRLLRSAVANAKNNNKIDVEKLYVKDVRVDKGPSQKRFVPRARGSMSQIEKKTCHITLVLGIREDAKKSRFTIIAKKKKEDIKAKKGEHGNKEAPAAAKSPKEHIIPSKAAKKAPSEKRETKGKVVVPGAFNRKVI
ncbi:MAG: 50S ribosomal protein L22 [Candidatus Paceibacterota bacterium]|jgi:large subunit ribosomal protein L22